MVFVGFEGTAQPFHFDAADDVNHLALVEDRPASLLREIEQLIQADRMCATNASPRLRLNELRSERVPANTHGLLSR